MKIMESIKMFIEDDPVDPNGALTSTIKQRRFLLGHMSVGRWHFSANDNGEHGHDTGVQFKNSHVINNL